MALLHACRADRPPDTARWYVEVPFERVAQAMLGLFGLAHAVPVITNLVKYEGCPARVYFDGSGYVVLRNGQQRYFADPGALWDADDTAAWARFKALVHEAEGRSGATARR